MKGCLALIGGAVVLVIGIAFCSAVVNVTKSSTANHRSSFAGASARTTSSADSCDVATSREQAAVHAVNNGQFQKAFDLAASGLHYNDSCDDSNDQLVNKGYLMTMRAISERHLRSGDWKTDLNEANAALVSCQTTPGLYGTHVGAQCETQEKNNIEDETNWEMQDAQQ